MELDGIISNPGADYSELLSSIQEYDQAISQYEQALENYEETFSNFKKGKASPPEMREAMDNFVYTDEKTMDAAIDAGMAAMDIQLEYALKGEENATTFATEHTLMVQKIEETTKYFEGNGDDFIKSLENIREFNGLNEKTSELMARDEEFLEENLGYTWEESMEKVSDYDFDEVDAIMENEMMKMKRNEVIQESPNDSYIGGFSSETGTEDITAKREQVLGSNHELVEKRRKVLGLNPEDLQEIRDKIKDEKPRYIH